MGEKDPREESFSPIDKEIKCVIIKTRVNNTKKLQFIYKFETIICISVCFLVRSKDYRSNNNIISHYSPDYGINYILINNAEYSLVSNTENNQIYSLNYRVPHYRDYRLVCDLGLRSSLAT